jgi:hypothetical protein
MSGGSKRASEYAVVLAKEIVNDEATRELAMSCDDSIRFTDPSGD